MNVFCSCLQLSTSVVFKLYFQNFPPKTSRVLCCHCVLVPVTIFLLSHWFIIGHTHNVHSPNNCFSIMGMILDIEVNIYTKYIYSWEFTTVSSNQNFKVYIISCNTSIKSETCKVRRRLLDLLISRSFPDKFYRVGRELIKNKADFISFFLTHGNPCKQTVRREVKKNKWFFG